MESNRDRQRRHEAFDNLSDAVREAGWADGGTDTPFTTAVFRTLEAMRSYLQIVDQSMDEEITLVPNSEK